MATKGVNQFKIDIVNLSNKVHEYPFSIDSSFFKGFENSPVGNASLDVHVKLEKSERLIIAHFRMNGIVELTCDRSLKLFDQSVDSIHKLIFKYGDREEEIDEEVIMIPWNKDHLDLKQYIYEFSVLSLPMKKLHPDFRTNEESISDEVVYSSTKNKGEKHIDPRWEKLKDIKTKSK